MFTNDILFINSDIFFIIVEYLESDDITNIMMTCKDMNDMLMDNHIWNYLAIRDLDIEGKIYNKKLYETYKFLYEKLNHYPVEKIYDFTNNLFNNNNITFITFEAFQTLLLMNEYKIFGDTHLSNLNLTNASFGEVTTTFNLNKYINGYDNIINFISYSMYESFEDLQDVDVRNSIIYSDAYYLYKTFDGNMNILKIPYNIEKWYYSFIVWYTTLKYSNFEIDYINNTIQSTLTHQLMKRCKNCKLYKT